MGEESGRMTTGLSETQRSALRAVCDTVVPNIERADDPDGFWRRKATDLGVDAGIEELMGTLPADQQAGLAELLEGLAEQGIERASQRSREQILRNVGLFGPDAAAGVSTLIGLALFLHYGAPDPETGQNPNWSEFGYPGPTNPPPD